jgi:hypothetical protein
MELISVKLAGGLGNMLFQIAAGYVTSIRDNKEFICDINEINSGHGDYTNYLSNFFRKIKFNSNIVYNNWYGENHFSYSPIPNLDGNLLIFGYFQSEKYFINYREDILKLFEIDEQTNLYLNDKYGELLKLKTCSIHVRRGDYCGQQEFHPVLDIEYYKKSIEYFDDDTHFLIFSNDIEWCENNFDFVQNKTFISGNHNYQDMYLMSLCDHNIIANSSFSWWGAWFNINKNKIVISPQIWFGYKYSNYNTKDLYCENWIKI